LCSFDKSHVVFYSDEGVPKLSQNVNFAVLSEDGMDNNVKWLGELIEGVILHQCDMTDEVTEFLELFKADGSNNFELICVHSAIVPTLLKNGYLCDTHEYMLDFVKKLDPTAYIDILQDLDFPSDWELQIANNVHLETNYCNRDPVWRNMARAQVQSSSALNPPSSVQVNSFAGSAPSSSHSHQSASMNHQLGPPLGPPVQPSAVRSVAITGQSSQAAPPSKPRQVVARNAKGKSPAAGNSSTQMWVLKQPTQPNINT
jgi:hypothetical protein